MPFYIRFRLREDNILPSVTSQGKYEEAELLYERCQVIQEEVIGPEHPNLAETLHTRARLLQNQVKSKGNSTSLSTFSLRRTLSVFPVEPFSQHLLVSSV